MGFFTGDFNLNSEPSFDLSSGGNWFDLGGGADNGGGYETGSGFWSFANKGLDFLGTLGGNWMKLQQQASQPTYYGQPEYTREQTYRPDINGGLGSTAAGAAAQGGGSIQLPTLLLIGIVAFVAAKAAD